MADKKIKVTLIHSTIGCVPKHRKIVEGIGLRKLNHSVELPDNESTRSIIRQVGYLLKVEE
ncbi:MAG: 50S ribosomal protein L30 [Bilifractor sp.]